MTHGNIFYNDEEKTLSFNIDYDNLIDLIDRSVRLTCSESDENFPPPEVGT